ncbi:MAG: DUF1464 family protein [Promethearchaeati archaeon SRVP18_Atabeyarchaeia-1]
MRALGIDPGTKNFDLLCIDGDMEHIVLDESLPSQLVADDPKAVFKVIEDAKPKVIVGPSGYGLEFKHISKFTASDVALTTLDKVGDVEIAVLTGLRKLLWMMKEAKMNAYSLPGVVQLPTVPYHRKINKIDMGTADKTCVAAYAVWDQARRLGIDYADTSLICVEMGFGYNAAIIVEKGQIVDGIGGTIFPGPGYLTHSMMDGELAYLLGEFTKLRLFEGGASQMASQGGARLLEPAEFVEGIESGGQTFVTAWSAMLEGIVKAVAMGSTVLEERPREVILTGRLSRIKSIFDWVESELSRKLDLKVSAPRRYSSKAKDVAQGAAIIANGVQGGEYEPLVKRMKIKESRGTVLDYITLPGFKVEEVVRKLKAK